MFDSKSFLVSVLQSLILLHFPQTKEDKWMGSEEEKLCQIGNSEFRNKTNINHYSHDNEHFLYLIIPLN